MSQPTDLDPNRRQTPMRPLAIHITFLLSALAVAMTDRLMAPPPSAH